MADSLSLKGKVALVTGSAKPNGVGAAIARALAKNGADVAIHHNSEASKGSAQGVAESLANEFGIKTTVVQGDISDQPSAERIVIDTLKNLEADRIDILVNNGATTAASPLLDASPDRLRHEFGVNVFGGIFMTQAIVKIGKMSKGGRIINISSIVSKMGMSMTGTYTAAKAAADACSACWAQELGVQHGITVNTVSLGPTPTDGSAPYLLKDGKPTEIANSMIALTRAEARLGTVQDVADIVLLLVQEKSRWITAQYISASGGITGWF